MQISHWTEPVNDMETELTLLLFLQKYEQNEVFMPTEIDFFNLYELSFLSSLTNEYLSDFNENAQHLFSYFDDELYTGGKNITKKWKEHRLHWEKIFAKRMKIFSRLPKEILETIEDLRIFALGYQTQQTNERIKQYVQEKTKTLLLG